MSAGGQIINGAQQVTQQIDGIDEVNVNVVWSPPWSMEMMSDDAKMNSPLLTKILCSISFITRCGTTQKVQTPQET